MSIKFSIITVVFNGNNCIEKTLKSVINQKNVDIEYIIIDGNSTDCTLKIVGEYKNKISIIISEKDNGLYDAMNKGLSYAQGDYILFMNCDDIFFDDFTLLNINNKLKENNLPSMIYGDSMEEDNNNNRFYKKSRSSRFLWYGMFTHHQSILYKTKLLKKFKITYNLKYTIGADYAFTAEVLTKNASTLYVESPLCVFKQDGLSSVNYMDGLKEQFDIRKNILKMGFLKRIILFFIHFILIHIRRKLPLLYKIFRFKGK